MRIALILLSSVGDAPPHPFQSLHTNVWICIATLIQAAFLHAVIVILQHGSIVLLSMRFVLNGMEHHKSKQIVDGAFPLVNQVVQGINGLRSCCAKCIEDSYMLFTGGLAVMNYIQHTASQHTTNVCEQSTDNLGSVMLPIIKSMVSGLKIFACTLHKRVFVQSHESLGKAFFAIES